MFYKQSENKNQKTGSEI